MGEIQLALPKSCVSADAKSGTFVPRDVITECGLSIKPTLFFSSPFSKKLNWEANMSCQVWEEIVAGLKSPVRKRSNEIITFALFPDLTPTHSWTFLPEKKRLFYGTEVLTPLLVAVINLNVRPHLLTLDA